MEYLTILVFILFGIFIELSNTNRKYSKIIYYAVHFGLIIIAGLRYRVGTDTIRYHEMFDNDIHWHLKLYQPVWNILNQLIDLTIGEFWGIQIICSIIFFLGLNKQFQQYPNSIFIATLLYFFPHFFTKNFELLRESLALGVFFLYGFKNLEKKKWINYYIISFICILIHLGSVYLFLLPILLKIKFEKINLFLLCNSLFMIFYFIDIRSDLLSLLQLVEALETKSNAYLVNQSNSYNINYVLKSLFEINLSLIFFNYIKFFLKPKQFILRFIAIPSVLISLGSITFIFPRLINYHLGIIIPLVGALFLNIIYFKIKKPFKLTILFSLILLFNISNYYSIFFSKKDDFYTYYKYYPYYSIFNKSKYEKRESEALKFN